MISRKGTAATRTLKVRPLARTKMLSSSAFSITRTT